MRMTQKWVAAVAASLLIFGCSDDGGDTKDTATDAGASVADGTSSGGDATSAGGDATSAGGDATSAGGDAASSSGGGDAAAGGKKYKTCPPLGDCVVMSCTKSGFEDGCEMACMKDASAEALASSATLLSCAKDTCIAKVCKDAKDKTACLMDCMPNSCGPGLAMCLEDGAPKDGKKPCVSITGCMDKCGSGKEPAFACLSKCVGEASPDARKLFAAFLKAVTDGGGADKCGMQCVMPMAMCFNNGTWGKDSCGGLLKCTDACKKDDDTCPVQCIAKGSEDAAKAFMGAGKCLGSTEAKCIDPLLTCLDPKGEQTCTESFGCVGTCVAEKVKGGMDKDDAESVCLFDCIAKADKQAAKAFLGMQVCDDKKPADGAPMPGKATGTDIGPSAACAQATMACGGAGAGQDSCGAMLQCVGACAAKKDADPAWCMLQCAGKATKEAGAAFVTHQKCAHDGNKACKGDAVPDACMKKYWGDTKGCMEAKKSCTP